MEKLYIVTGAGGHLGSTIIRLLRRSGEHVRGLIFGEESGRDSQFVTYIKGDIRNQESLYPLFEHTADQEVYVIHAAGLVNITEDITEIMYDTNVRGTANVIALCKKYGVKRLLYVSSVHAIPEGHQLQVIKEVSEFSPDRVEGGYAKTKAEATQLVLDAAKEGLDTVVVHPSGIIGPFDDSTNYMVVLVKDYLNGKLPACVRGGYDFVDVRDVARGCLLAAEKGRRGECYILSNRHYEISDLLRMARHTGGGRRIPVLPIWMAKAGMPILERISGTNGERALYTTYALYKLNSNDRFSHDKAARELGYHPRDLYITIRDTVKWLKRRSQQTIKEPDEK